jgi:hypothetical protein
MNKMMSRLSGLHLTRSAEFNHLFRVDLKMLAINPGQPNQVQCQNDDARVHDSPR